MEPEWKRHAERLAAEVTYPRSRWYGPIAATPRHLLVPRWWERGWQQPEWELCDGPADPAEWLATAYADQTLVTRVGPLHADHALSDDLPTGRPTSSSTLPSLVIRMLRHGQIYDGADVLDVGTGSGYGAALLGHRLGDQHVTSVDVDPYLTKVAAERLDTIGLHPEVTTGDATGRLPGSYDRIVSMVSVRPIPPSWLAALRPGGRLVTVIADTTIIVTANKADDGTATGQVEWDRAAFMATRSGPDYPPGRLSGVWAAAHDHDGDVTRGPYPVVAVNEAWELQSVLEVLAPGIEHGYSEDNDGRRTAWMVHADGSWARATAVGDAPPVVHQGGPRRLWDILDETRQSWLSHGYFQLYGAKVTIAPDGTCHLRRGRWQATIG
ncbi:MAG: methyltransferase domain-containing protein [Sporichthyaceae bacterium]|nr:methyltransferase domain-containing protein [Sporichthyaceae bacterium]